MTKQKQPSDMLPSIKGVREITQLAIITRDTEKMASVLSRALNLGAFKIFSAKSPQLFDATYGNQPEGWSMKAALTWLGKTQFEIIEPTSGRTVYHDYLEARNQQPGIEHIYLDAKNFKATKSQLENAGYPLQQEAKLNAAGRIGWLPIPALPSFLKHMAAGFGYTSTIQDLKVDLEIAKFPRGVSQRFALKAAIPEKWIPAEKPIHFEKLPPDAPIEEVHTLYIMCNDLAATVKNYAKITTAPPKIRACDSSMLHGEGKIAAISIGTKTLHLLQPTSGEIQNFLHHQGEGLYLLGVSPRTSVQNAAQTLKRLGWECSRPSKAGSVLATHSEIPFTLLISPRNTD